MRHLAFGLSLTILLAAFSRFSSFGAPVAIVQDGQPAAMIFVAANEPQAMTAAKEIQKYIAKMSGAKLDLIEEGKPVDHAPRFALYVGHTAAAKAAGVKVPAGFNPAIRADAFEEEGYILKTKDNALFIGGNCDGPYQGDLYAAYGLLEKLGCRWYFPGAWGEIVPEMKTVSVPDLSVESRPDFPVRGIWLSGWVPVSAEERKIYADWCVKVGFTGPKGLYPGVGDGYLDGLLPPDEYFDKHPEYFAMDKKGNRTVGKLPNGKYYSSTTMLCLSNPDVFTESVKNLKAAFAGEKKLMNVSANGFGISPPDGAPFCYCDQCLAGSQNFNYPNYVHERMQSEEFFGFAVKLAKEFPDKWVATFAYSLREMPPQGVKLTPNVTVYYAPISCCVLHPNNDPTCWRRQEYVDILTQWRKQTPHVYIYDYNPGFLLGLFVPERDVANMAVNAPIYKQIGIKGMGREGRKCFMQTWLSYYVTAKLLWDSKTDVNALKKDFYTTFFGPEAGPQVQAWWDACEDALLKATVHVHEDWLVNHIYTVEFTKGIHKFVEAARQAKMTDTQKAHVEAFALIADHLEAFAEMEQADMDLDYAKAAAAGKRLDADKQKLSDTYSFFIGLEHRAVPRSYFSDGRTAKYEELAAMAKGDKGTMLAPLPLVTKFTRDPYHEGVIREWYAPDFDDSKWGTENTFYVWDQQDKPEDAIGHDYDGYGWYRATVNIPKSAIGKPVHYWDGGAINEAWIWVNGQYAGHKPTKLWWLHPHDFDLNVTDLVKPGKNTLAILVYNSAEIGGLYRRGFFWAPKEEVKTAEEKK